jgi:hypothetical protein
MPKFSLLSYSENKYSENSLIASSLAEFCFLLKMCVFTRISNILMDNYYTIHYEPPVCKIIDVEAEHTICGSGGIKYDNCGEIQYNGFGEEESW